MKTKLFFIRIFSLFLLLSVIFSESAFSQTLPDFKIKMTDGKIFSASDVSHKKPLVIIYFAPDCEHCQVLMKQLFQKINAFKNTEIVMVTFESLNDIAGFEKQYQTSKYPNIKVGVEVPVFFFKNHYQLEHTPFTALFNKNGKLMVSYKDYTPVDELIKWVKSIEKK